MRKLTVPQRHIGRRGSACGSWTWISHPAPRRRLAQGGWGDSGGTEQPCLAHPSALTSPVPAAEQRQVWGGSPSLGPWHPPLRSTHRVGSVGQVRTQKINGAGAGLKGGQSPGQTRSPVETECPTQARNQSRRHSAWLGLAWRGAEASSAVSAAHPIPSPQPHLASSSLHHGGTRAQPGALSFQINVFVSLISQVTHCRKV